MFDGRSRSRRLRRCSSRRHNEMAGEAGRSVGGCPVVWPACMGSLTFVIREFQSRASYGRAPFPHYREQHRGGEKDEHQGTRAHAIDIMTARA
jgi:hypothetical protein